MAEYRLRVITPGAGPRHKVDVRSSPEPGPCGEGDMYLCGHCGIILRRGDLPPEPLRCSNCGAVNAPTIEES